MSEPSSSNDNPVFCFNCVLQCHLLTHIKCAECPAIICLPCFQCGAESGKHRRGHNYEIVDPQGTSACSSSGEWGYLDESRLLKAAHQFKMGNWGEIVESMGGNRRVALEAKEYFDKVFVRGWMGQFAIKNADWDRIKYEMYRKDTLDTVLKANSSDSVERLLMIRDALLDSNQVIDEDDPKMMFKVQNILENYVYRCKNGSVPIKWQRAKVVPSPFETELSFDECDPNSNDEIEIPRKLAKKSYLDDDCEAEYPQNSKSSTKKLKSVKKTLKREPSSDSDEDSKSDEFLHGLEPEEDEQEEEASDSIFEGDETTAEGSDDEGEEVDEKEIQKPKSSRKPRRKRKLKFGLTKKMRRLVAYKVKMSCDENKRTKELGKLTEICPLHEVKELRNALPRLVLETKTTPVEERVKMKQDDLTMLGYNVDREEFEHEWFHDAELLISRLTITPADPVKNIWLDIENDIKFARIQNYIRIMGIRKAKRNAILEHDKISEFFNFMRKNTLRRRDAYEDINNRTETDSLLTRAQQFLTKEEYASLTECITKVDSLTEKISQLQVSQRAGETTIKQEHPGVVAMKNKRMLVNSKRRKMTKIDLDIRRREKLGWARYQRSWHHNV